MAWQLPTWSTKCSQNHSLSLTNRCPNESHHCDCLHQTPEPYTVDQVRWFRAQAHKDHWREEVQMLEAEFQHTVVSYKVMNDVWTQLGNRCDASEVGEGQCAYAYQQAAMYNTMATHCQACFEEAKGRKHKSSMLYTQLREPFVMLRLHPLDVKQCLA
jgi:hypothetical protein